MKADSKTEAEVMAVLQQFADAYGRRNWEGLRAVLSPDEDNVMYGTGADEKRIGIAQIKQQAERDWAQTEAATIEFGWRLVSAASNVAWVATDVTFRAKAGGQEMALPGRLTLTLEKRGGKWLAAQSHFSFPAAGQAEGESLPT